MRYGSVRDESEPDDLREIPDTVAETLALNSPSSDRPLYLTFRYFLLSIVFVIPGAFVDTLNSYRTTSAPYSILFVQFLSDPAGRWLAKVLPRKTVNLLGFRFSLNPGPWSIKESVLVTLTAASGATGNQGTAGLSLSEIYYDRKVHPFVALVFMYSIVWTGYSFGAIARNFVLYEPQFVWPKALMQTSLRACFAVCVAVFPRVHLPVDVVGRDTVLHGSSQRGAEFLGLRPRRTRVSEHLARLEQHLVFGDAEPVLDDRDAVPGVCRSVLGISALLQMVRPGKILPGADGQQASALKRVTVSNNTAAHSGAPAQRDRVRAARADPFRHPETRKHLL
ncbi:hypothetical protein KL910_000471 [Ogataea haglerorum]|nr:hypothetical protein KL945_004815 [Ogataea haglerorum]KAG7793776.1 hypothetical protein KL910_000471 [Ogataea haglerorum]